MDPITFLLRFVGARLLRVARVFFAHGGDVDRSEGPLELTFDRGAVVLRIGGDGATLIAEDGAWQDPFPAASLSPENQAWIARHGKWSLFDLSDAPDYRPLVDAVLTSIRPLRTSNGRVCGVRLEFGKLTIDFAGTTDESLVFLHEQNDLRLAEMKVYVGEEVPPTR